MDTPGTIKLRTDFAKQGQVKDTIIDFHLPDFSTQVELTYDAFLTRLKISPFIIEDKYDFSLSFDENENLHEISIQGNFFDISALTNPTDFGLPDGIMVTGKKGQSPFDWVNKFGGNLSIQLDVDNLLMNNGVIMKAVSAVVERQDNIFEKIVLNGSFTENNRLSYVLYRDENLKRHISLEVPKAEYFFKGLGFLDGIEGGYMSLNGTIPDTSPDNSSALATDKTLAEGYAYLVDFSMRDLPVLARILSLGSFQGISDILNGEGLRFDGAEMRYRITPEEFKFIRLKANGQSMGLTLDGQISLRNTQANLGGNIYPAYSLNSIVGNLPVVGQVLTGGREGVVGISYDLKGPLSNLNVNVNPLSILVPEVLKEIVSVRSTR
jgi:hypothetical protein